MTSLILSSSFKTPEINFDALSGELKMTGRVFPENPKEFFSPIMQWMNSYFKEPAGKTCLIFNLSYFNSSSNEYIFRCCKMMEDLASTGHDVKIVWEFEEDDDDMRQLGEDFKELLKINFEINSVN
jgi:hypothetical protein